MQIGRKSEKLQRQIEQLELRLEELESNHGEKASPPEPSSVATALIATPATPARRALPDHLPRQTRRHEPKETVCPQCRGASWKLGEDVSEMLEYVPASFVVVRHVRTKLSCTKCDCIVQAEAPSHPFDRGLPGRDCWRMFWCRNTVIISRCIGSRRSTRVKVWNWGARRWRTGWARAAGCWSGANTGTRRVVRRAVCRRPSAACCARAASLLRSGTGAQFAGNARSAASDRRAVWNRRTDSRSTAR
jgi:hypothetical protein